MSAAELTAANATSTPDTPIERVLPSERVPILFPDMPLDSALHYFPRWPFLPVLNRASKGKLEGIVTQDDVLHCYQEH